MTSSPLLDDLCPPLMVVKYFIVWSRNFKNIFVHISKYPSSFISEQWTWTLKKWICKIFPILFCHLLSTEKLLVHPNSEIIFGTISNFHYLRPILLSLFPKSIDQVPLLACAWNGIAATSHDICAASNRFLINLWHYGIEQLYLRKIP